MSARTRQPNIRLKNAREELGLSQRRVAELIDTLERNVSRWERGYMPYPHYREKLCELFKKNAHELGFMEEESKPAPSSGPSAPPSVPFSDPRIPPLSNKDRDLVGRQELFNILLEQLCAGKIVAISGLPGVGKTALAVALVHHPRVLDTFHDGILWAGLGPHPNLLEQLSRWLQYARMWQQPLTERKQVDATSFPLSLPQSSLYEREAEESNEAALVARSVALRETIGMRRMLLVIDDAWDIEAALPFKVGGPDCALLVTTRFPTIAVSLAEENAHVLHELPADDGLALLTQLAPKAVAYDRQTASELVRAVGGLPLALTLMGKYLQTQSHSDQPRRIQAALKLLLDASQHLLLSGPLAPSEIPPGLESGTPLSLRAVIDVSYQQLTEPAQALLCALSVFPPKPNSFSEEAALAVSQASPAVLDQLSDAGLLESSGVGRYSLHQTIANYAAANLTETLPSERLVAYVVAFLEQHATDYEALEMESGNILAGLRYAYDAGQHARFVQGVMAFAPFLLAHGLYDQAKLHLQRAHQLLIWSGDSQIVMTLLLHLGYVAYKQEDYNQAEAHLREGLALARQRADTQHIHEALTYLAHVAEARGDIVQMEAYLHEAATKSSPS